jgi:hypothetical protein
MPTTTGERRGGTARPPERLAPGVPHRQGLINQGTSHPHFTAPPYVRPLRTEAPCRRTGPRQLPQGAGGGFPDVSSTVIQMGVAQMARASVSKTECRRFDSCHPCDRAPCTAAMLQGSSYLGVVATPGLPNS